YIDSREPVTLAANRALVRLGLLIFLFLLIGATDILLRYLDWPKFYRFRKGEKVRFRWQPLQRRRSDGQAFKPTQLLE
ncbi:MAG: hypothetical protein WBX14_13985, partial [Candidatus Udaeobacter sp.]